MKTKRVRLILSDPEVGAPYMGTTLFEGPEKEALDYFDSLQFLLKGLQTVVDQQIRLAYGRGLLSKKKSLSKRQKGSRKV